MLSEIERQSEGFSPAEKRVAMWVLKHPNQAAGATLAAVSAACGASEPTVIRFCRRIGVRGFREFTRRLTEALSQPVSNIHRDLDADDSAADAVTKVIDASIRTLIDIRTKLSAMPFAIAVDALSAARQVAFVGLGASGHVASDACQKFFRLGLPCTALTDTPTILQFAAIVRHGDVLVFASQIGQSADLARAARTARDNGGTVMALTDPDSALANAAEILFACPAQADANVYTPMSSRLAHLAVLDAMQVALAIALGEQAVENLRRCKEALLV
jgi:RpiR family transcriptional regulator, carbohydrate utilization regulator